MACPEARSPRGVRELDVSWSEWQGVQETLTANSTVRDRKRGAALLQGLSLCGHCGRSIQVLYNVDRSYCCNQRTADTGQNRSCLSVGVIGIDKAVAERFMDLVSPAGAEAAQAVVERAEAALRSQLLELEHCRCEAGLAKQRSRQPSDRADPGAELGGGAACRGERSISGDFLQQSHKVLVLCVSRGPCLAINAGAPSFAALH